MQAPADTIRVSGNLLFKEIAYNHNHFLCWTTALEKPKTVVKRKNHRHSNDTRMRHMV